MRCVVTGAASGIGREVALLLAHEGHEVMITDRDETGLTQTGQDVEAMRPGSLLDAQALDVTEVEQVKSWADRLIVEHGTPDEVYHVAGIAIWGDPRTMPHDKWVKVIEVNLMGSVHIVEAFTPALTAAGPIAERGEGLFGRKPKKRRLCMVSSAAGIIGLPWHAAYSASKGGVMGMCEVLRFDLAPHGVSVHVAAPGAVDTPLVGTIDIDKVDQTNERVAKVKKLFQGHADSPAEAAHSIVSGVRKGRYLIFTSFDIRLGRWAQVNMPWAYRGVMRLLNRGLRWAAADAVKAK
ncbi:MAG TPA: SDR family oxidoreductase [Candidatus Corynebacterium avicola]|uniref:SDR family oxidoreductase n=1 Tax=Candidatus Corynebacterium avicola TaxID=2838527 RepID=A0A9D1RRY3_9CORY|nr:SDR family oxidoreductase [Candidatus Corynebacterium avicola]